jgi:hypothetical protein
MDKEIKAFFLRIVNTIAVILLWLFINMALGLKLRMSEIGSHISWINWLFYIWALLTGIAVIFYVKRLWRNKIKLPY